MTMILLGAIAPTSFAAQGGSVTIVSPTDGATIPIHPAIDVHLGERPPGQSTLVQLLMDGTVVASFSPVIIVNTTNIRFTPWLGNFSSGAHVLQARVRSNNTTAWEESAPVSIILDTPPSVSGSASFDASTGEVVFDVHVADDFSTPLVSLTTASGQHWNGSFVGSQEVRFPVTQKPGTYNATLFARDRFAQWNWTLIPYVVEPRPATASDVSAEYRAGGVLEVRASVVDPDGVARVSVETPLGGGSASSPTSGDAWAIDVNVTPRVGTFQGTLHVMDLLGDSTRIPFSFTIDPPRETLFAYENRTFLGAHHHVFRLPLPAVVNGTIDICLDACGEPWPTTHCPPVGEPCNALRGDPSVAGRAPCRAQAPHAGSDPAGWGAWYATQAADRGETFPTSNPLGANLPQASLFPSPGVCRDASEVAGGAILVRIDGANDSDDVVCASSRHGMTTCSFSIAVRSSAVLEVVWATGPYGHASVEVSGIRV